MSVCITSGPEIFRLDLLPLRSVRVRKDVDGKRLVKEVAKALEWDPATTRLWQVSHREKGSHSIEFSLPKLTEPCLSSTLIFWAQQVPANPTDAPPLSVTAASPPTSRLFFFKEFANRTVHQIEPASLLAHLTRTVVDGEVIFFQIHPDSPILYNSCLVAEETGKDAASLIGSPQSPPMASAVVDQDTSFIPGPLAMMLSFVSACLVIYQLRYIVCSQVEILLVDKLRKSDPGILMRLSPSLDYKAFANLVANYLSAQPDRLQFFTPQPISALNQAQQGGSPVNSEGPGGNGSYSPTGATDLISVQSIAAKASGFSGASPQFISALASIAHQGLTREPPGPPIPSTISGTLRDFLQLPAAAYPVPSQAAATNFALANAGQDRPPQLIARYSGISTTTASPFGNLSFP
ncbi:unnamed protein product, partial [Dibothriocephalus latus]